MHYKLFITVCLLSLLTESLHAEDSTSPESVVKAYFDAFKTGDMSEVAALMHSGELRKFKSMMLPVIKKGIEATDETSEQEDKLAVKLLTRDASIESISDESPREFFARFMNWIMVLNPAMQDSISQANISTIGFVPEGELAHVVFRVTVDVMGAPMNQISVMTVKKQENEWKLMLTGEIEGMSKMLQMNIEQLSR